MLENLFNLIKEHAGEAVIENPAIPNAQNNEVLAEATHSVASGFQKELAGGGLQRILALFGSQPNNTNSLMNNPLVGSMISNFTKKLSGNYNMQDAQAGNVAKNLIPQVIESLVSRTNDPNNTSFNMNSIIGALSGKNTSTANENTVQTTESFDFQSLIGQFTKEGLDANQDGKIGLDDIISKITNGAQQQSRQEVGTANSNGLMDIIKGFIK